MARIALDARKLHDFGIGTYLQNLIAGLIELDGDDELILFLRPGAEAATSPRIQTLRTTAGNYGIAEHVSLPRLARRHGADLYHAPHYVLPWLTRMPSVVTIHDLIHLRFPQYLPNRAAHIYAKTMIRRSFERATRVITVSEATRRDLLQEFGGDESHIVVIPNSVPAIFFKERSPEELARVRERWRLNARFILYTGNVKPHKNLDRLVRAFARVREIPDLRDLELVFLGNEPGRYQSLRLRASELGVLPAVRFLGWSSQAELCCLYRLAHVYAYPSLFEGFGLPPLEAMASGLPVVAADTSSLPEVCGDAAVLVKPTDVDAVAAGLIAAASDESLRKDLISRGRVRARGFQARTQAARTLAVYRAVLG